MQQDFAELTIAAINGLYGELSSQIYAHLAYTGRRTLQEIVRQTHFSSRQVGATLIVLIQHQLVQHWTNELGQTFYVANGEVAYDIVFRYEKLVTAVDDSLGEDAALVVHQVAFLGHATPAKLQRALGLEKSSPKSQINGSGKNRNKKPVEVQAEEVAQENEPKSAISSVEVLYEVLKQLLELGYLSLTTKSQFTPLKDLQNEAEAQVLVDFFPKGLLTASDKKQLPVLADNLKRKWRDDANSYLTTKRLRLEPSANATNGANHGSQLKDDVVVKLNFEKCNVILRNQQLANYAHRYIGETTSKVFRALMSALESTMTRCFDPLGDSDWADLDIVEESGSTFPSLHTILRYLPEDLDLNVGLSERLPAKNGVNGHTSGEPETILSSDTDEGDEDVVPHSKHNNKRRANLSKNQKNLSKASRATDQGVSPVFLVEKHLRLLAQDPRGFVRQVDHNGWTVPFRQLTRSLIQYEIENTVAARYGQLAARIVRILQKNKANDEKGLAASAVIKPKDVRSLTNTLLNAGIVETQEIPRDTNRTTNRLLWLYVYSPENARKQIILESYRAMSRWLRRLEVEKNEYTATIDKSERLDVVGNEEKFLNEGDKIALEHWSKKEELILGQMSRIDDLIACMRDFAPLGDAFIGHRRKQEDLELEELSE